MITDFWFIFQLHVDYYIMIFHLQTDKNTDFPVGQNRVHSEIGSSEVRIIDMSVCTDIHYSFNLHLYVCRNIVYFAKIH